MCSSDLFPSHDSQDAIFSYDASGHHVCHDDTMKFIQYVEDQIGFKVKLASFGPTANDVREL